jgi:hypothetical protein
VHSGRWVSGLAPAAITRFRSADKRLLPVFEADYDACMKAWICLFAIEKPCWTTCSCGSQQTARGETIRGETCSAARCSDIPLRGRLIRRPLYCSYNDKATPVFADDWKETLKRAGGSQSELHLFGCDRERPWARIDRAGLIWLLDGHKIIAFTADTLPRQPPARGRLIVGWRSNRAK